MTDVVKIQLGQLCLNRYIIFVIMSTLFQQFQQVQQQQLRIAKYHQIYTQSLNEQYSQNEFLSIPHSQPQESFCQVSEDLPLFESKPAEVDHKEPPQIFESHIVSGREEIRLSRIFEDIVLIDQSHRGYHQLFDVQLEIEGMVISLSTLHQKDEHYSLSNFSSFNNCVNKAEAEVDFRELLECIQETTGKTLTKAAIDSIISQLTQYKQLIADELQARLNKQTTKKHQFSDLTDSYFDVTEQQKHKFDTTLNNCPFQRQKKKDQHFESVRSELRGSAHRSLFEIQKNHKENPQDKLKKGTSKSRAYLKESCNREEKENRREKPHNKEGAHRNMRVVGKGGKQLTMSFAQPKHIEHFCIVNKIFGKEKDKLMRAVNANKSIIHLQ